MLRAFFIVAVVSLMCSSLNAQQRFLFSSYGFYTNTSKISNNFSFTQFPYEEHTYTFDNIIGFGIDIRRKFVDENFTLGISTEYFSLTKSHYENIYTSLKDGFSIIPIELSGYFNVPLNNQNLHWYVGGGMGLYLGKRNLTVNNTPSSSSMNTGFGIHVSSGVEYFFSEIFGVRSEVKFRDAQFESINTFSHSPAPPEFITGKYSSEVHVDGIMLTGGIVMKF